MLAAKISKSFEVIDLNKKGSDELPFLFYTLKENYPIATLLNSATVNPFDTLSKY